MSSKSTHYILVPALSIASSENHRNVKSHAMLKAKGAYLFIPSSQHISLAPNASEPRKMLASSEFMR
jgi:hypothetical protein